MLSLYLGASQHNYRYSQALHLPFIVNRLDIETQSWADCIDILAHDLLDYSSLPSIIESAVNGQQRLVVYCGIPYSMRILISLSFNLAFRKIDNILPVAGRLCC
jgi:hypothetical protein